MTLLRSLHFLSSLASGSVWVEAEGCPGAWGLCGPSLTCRMTVSSFPLMLLWHGLKSAQSSPANASSSSDSSSDSDFEPSQNHSQGGYEGKMELVEGMEAGHSLGRSTDRPGRGVAFLSDDRLGLPAASE